jgi:hypothetical protein
MIYFQIQRRRRSQLFTPCVKRDADGDDHDAIAGLARGPDLVLVIGPSTAKLELVKYADEHDHPLATRIVGT